MQKDKKLMFVVLGMHRSGTSAITKGLEVLGASLGDRLMPPVAGNNDKGFFEDVDINAFNIEALNVIGSDWFCISPISQHDVDQLDQKGFALRAIELLREKIKDTDIFAFKDPRVAKLMPFWKMVFEHLGVKIFYVIALRHPLSVVKSLSKRDSLSSVHSYLLWLGHVLESLKYSTGQIRTIVEYDKLIDRPEIELQRIAEISRLNISNEKIFEYKKFLDDGLRHSVYEPIDLALDKACPPIVKEVYEYLNNVSIGQANLEYPAFAVQLSIWLEEFKRLKTSLIYIDEQKVQISTLNHIVSAREGQFSLLNQAVQDREGQISSMNQAVTERDGQVAQLILTIQEREGEIIKLNQAVSERDGQVAQLSLTVQNREGEIFNLRQAVSERDGEISNLNYAFCELNTQVSQLSQTIHMNEEKISSKDKAHTENDKQVAQLSQLMQVQVEEINTQNEAAALLNSRIIKLNQILDDKNTHIRNIEQIALDRITMVKDIKESLSWRLTSPLRRVGTMYIKNIQTIKMILSLLPKYVKSCGGLYRATVNITKELNRIGWSELIKRATILNEQIKTKKNDGQSKLTPYEEYILNMEPSSADLLSYQKISKKFKYKPKFSIVVPVYNVDAKWLTAFIESVIGQAYPNWELCIADDNSSSTHIKPILQKFALKDKRIKLVFRESNGHISIATNTALELATGDYVCLMDNDDEIAPQALFEFASLLNRDKSIDMIYSDEDKLDMEGNRYEPFFKPDWSPEALEGCMFTAHFACYRMSLVRELGGFRSNFNGAQDYDFVLRFTERANKIVHIPKILYHWRAIPGSTAASMDAKDYVLDAAVRALSERAERVAGGGEVRLGEYSGCFDLRYKINGNPLVSIIIPSAGRMAKIKGKNVDLLSQVIISIHEKTSYKNFEIIIVDNNDLRPETLAAISRYNCRYVHYSDKFNIATKMNLGAEIANGDYLLFMNDDIEIINEDWMDCMLQLCQRKGVGVVGAKLHFENESLQHVGVAFWNGLPDHIHRAYPKTSPGHFFSAVANRNYLAVTGAVLMTKKEIFKDANGFEEKFAINYNDIDYCLKVFSKGFRIVFAAGAKLTHYESLSRNASVATEEIDLFQEKWKNFVCDDPYYSNYFDDHPPVFDLRKDWNYKYIIDPLKSTTTNHK
jgi:glycosyltransferase involved in cell wall biosynthesis